MSSFKSGLFASFSIFLGYIPVAIAFGIYSRGTGLGVLDSIIISALIFAGASQFAMVSLLASGVASGGASIAALVLNLRHLLYGPLIAPFLKGASTSRIAQLAFGLTDEVFAAAYSQLEKIPEEERASWLSGLEIGAYLSWISGTLLGAAGGSVLLSQSPYLSSALSFALPALFLALLLPLLRWDSAVSALIAVVVALSFHYHGQTSLGILAAGVSGPFAGIALKRLIWRAAY